MRSLAELEQAIAAVKAEADPAAAAQELLCISEEVLEHWIAAKEMDPTQETREGFRLLALHRQGTKGEPGFNACRETCREIAYHYNLVTMQANHVEIVNSIEMMRMICSHLFLFISGKMQVAELGEFCCSSKPMRLTADPENRETKEV